MQEQGLGGGETFKPHFGIVPLGLVACGTGCTIALACGGMTGQSKFVKSCSSGLGSWEIFLARFIEEGAHLVPCIFSLSFSGLDALSLNYRNKMDFSHW